MSWFKVRVAGVFGDGAKTVIKTEKEVGEMLNNLERNSETGEVKGVRSVEEVKPKENT